VRLRQQPPAPNTANAPHDTSHQSTNPVSNTCRAEARILGRRPVSFKLRRSRFDVFRHQSTNPFIHQSTPRPSGTAWHGFCHGSDLTKPLSLFICHPVTASTPWEPPTSGAGISGSLFPRCRAKRERQFRLLMPTDAYEHLLTPKSDAHFPMILSGHDSVLCASPPPQPRIGVFRVFGGGLSIHWPTYSCGGRVRAKSSKSSLSAASSC
jgi:hypothetical protein